MKTAELVFAVIGAWFVAAGIGGAVWIVLRRWWPPRDPKPPAGSSAPSPECAETASPKLRSSLPGPAPSPPVTSRPLAGTGTTARTRATIDVLGCGCAITYYRTSHIKGTYPSTCPQHECALCRWVPDRAHAVYTWQPCPAHEPVVTP